MQSIDLSEYLQRRDATNALIAEARKTIDDVVARSPARRAIEAVKACQATDWRLQLPASFRGNIYGIA